MKLEHPGTRHPLLAMGWCYDSDPGVSASDSDESSDDEERGFEVLNHKGTTVLNYITVYPWKVPLNQRQIDYVEIGTLFATLSGFLTAFALSSD